MEFAKNQAGFFECKVRKQAQRHELSTSMHMLVNRRTPNCTENKAHCTKRQAGANQAKSLLNGAHLGSRRRASLLPSAASGLDGQRRLVRRSVRHAGAEQKCMVNRGEHPSDSAQRLPVNVRRGGAGRFLR